MKKIRHEWEKLKGTNKLKHAICKHCQLQKFFNDRFGQLVYQDLVGRIYYRTPSCKPH